MNTLKRFSNNFKRGDEKMLGYRIEFNSTWLWNEKISRFTGEVIYNRGFLSFYPINF